MNIDDIVKLSVQAGKAEVLKEVLSMSHEVGGKYYQILKSDFDYIVSNITNTTDKDEPCPT
jgi:hypothetical protein